MLEVIWLFTYGEYYNWSDSHVWCTVLCALPITVFFACGRMMHIHHPYIDPRAFGYKTLVAILFFFVVEEWMKMLKLKYTPLLTIGFALHNELHHRMPFRYHPASAVKYNWLNTQDFE